MTTEQLYHALLLDPYFMDFEQISRLTTYQMSQIVSKQPPSSNDGGYQGGWQGGGPSGSGGGDIRYWEGGDEVDPPEWENLGFKDYFIAVEMSEGKTREYAEALFRRIYPKHRPTQ